MGVSTGCRRGRIWNDSSSSTGVDRGPKPAAATRRARHRGLPEGPHRPGQRHEGRPAAVDGLPRRSAPGDTLVIWRIDRLGRNLRDFIDIVTTLQARGVGVRSLSNGLVDTTTAHAALVFGMFALIAEYEAALIRERTQAGLAAARARGRKGWAETQDDPRADREAGPRQSPSAGHDRL